jgi:hypothetical protein
MPGLHPIERAQRDIDVATYGAIVSGTVSLVLGLLILMADASSRPAMIGTGLDIVFSFGLAYGIARRSRGAAIAALALLALNTASRLFQSGFPSGLLGAAVFGYCYVRGIRGTFSYQRHRSTASHAAAPSAPAA